MAYLDCSIERQIAQVTRGGQLQEALRRRSASTASCLALQSSNGACHVAPNPDTGRADVSLLISTGQGRYESATGRTIMSMTPTVVSNLQGLRA